MRQAEAQLALIDHRPEHLATSEPVIPGLGGLRDRAIKSCIGFLAAAFSTGTIVSAQETVRGWTGLDPSDLSTVYVLDDTGREVTGRLLRLERDAIAILVEGQELEFEASRVQRLDKRGDSLRNGAYIGAVVGLVMGLVSAQIADCVDDTGRVGSCGAATKVGVTMLSSGLYAAIGTGIDAVVRGRTTLYEAPDTGATSLDQLGDRVGDEAVLLSATFSW